MHFVFWAVGVLAGKACMALAFRHWTPPTALRKRGGGLRPWRGRAFGQGWFLPET